MPIEFCDAGEGTGTLCDGCTEAAQMRLPVTHHQFHSGEALQISNMRLKIATKAHPPKMHRELVTVLNESQALLRELRETPRAFYSWIFPTWRNRMKLAGRPTLKTTTSPRTKDQPEAQSNDKPEGQAYEEPNKRIKGQRYASCCFRLSLERRLSASSSRLHQSKFSVSIRKPWLASRHAVWFANPRDSQVKHSSHFILAISGQTGNNSQGIAYNTP